MAGVGRLAPLATPSSGHARIGRLCSFLHRGIRLAWLRYLRRNNFIYIIPRAAAGYHSLDHGCCHRKLGDSLCFLQTDACPTALGRLAAICLVGVEHLLTYTGH